MNLSKPQFRKREVRPPARPGNLRLALPPVRQGQSQRIGLVIRCVDGCARIEVEYLPIPHEP